MNRNTALKNLAIYRILISVITLYLFWNITPTSIIPYQASFDSNYATGFFKFFPVITSDNFIVINYLWITLTILVILGLFTKAALTLLIPLGFYKFAYSFAYGWIPFGHAIPYLFFIGLTFTNCNSYYSLDAKYIKSLKSKLDPNYSLMFLRLLISIYYFNAGVSKLIGDPINWLNGNNLSYAIQVQMIKNDLALFLLNEAQYILVALSIITVLIEILAPLSIIGNKFGVFFFLAWSCLHLGINQVLGGHNFFFLNIPYLIVFLPISEVLTKIKKGD